MRTIFCSTGNSDRELGRNARFPLSDPGCLSNPDRYHDKSSGRRLPGCSAETGAVAGTDFGMDGAGKEKLTLFNDGIFGSETDLGTYGTLSPETPGQKICSREEELEWQKNEMCGKFCGGEAIWGSGAEPAPFVSAPKAMADLERMHISYLNSTYDLRRLEQWKAETVEDESGLEAIGKRLGYRFVVEGVEFVSEREELQITLENKGFAELTEEADCYLELERNGTLQKKYRLQQMRDSGRAEKKPLFARK